MLKQFNKIKINSHFNKIKNKYYSVSNDLIKSSKIKKIKYVGYCYYGLVVATTTFTGIKIGTELHFEQRRKNGSDIDDFIDLGMCALTGGCSGFMFGIFHPVFIISWLGIRLHDKYFIPKIPIVNSDAQKSNDFVVKIREYAPGCTHHVFHGKGDANFSLEDKESRIFEDGDNVIIRYFDCDEDDPYGRERISSYACHCSSDTVYSIPIKEFEQNPCKYMNNYLLTYDSDNSLVKMCLQKK